MAHSSPGIVRGFFVARGKAKTRTPISMEHQRKMKSAIRMVAAAVALPKTHKADTA